MAARNQRKGIHSAVEDAALAMKLYLSRANEWEKLVSQRGYNYSIEDSRSQIAKAKARKTKRYAASYSRDDDDYYEEDSRHDDHWYGPSGEGGTSDGYWEDEGEWVYY